MPLDKGEGKLLGTGTEDAILSNSIGEEQRPVKSVRSYEKLQAHWRTRLNLVIPQRLVA